MATTVTWVQDANSRYEVSSKEHLLQLMNRGSLYTDTGTPPPAANYWLVDYIQTVDIDLVDNHADIHPIGIFSPSRFEGGYDGGEFTISNWSYTDPATDVASCLGYVGLFGYAENAVLKNIRMSGVCCLDGFKDYGAFVVSRLQNGECRNTECDFSPGTFIVGGGKSGSIIGLSANSTLVGVRLLGTIDMVPTDVPRGGSPAVYMGGVIGEIQVAPLLDRVVNAATFPNGIQGANVVGGVFGYAAHINAGMTNFFNFMTGDISGTTVGGIVGQLHGGTVPLSRLVNSMTGNLTGVNHAGGILGFAQAQGLVFTEAVNYMTGDISDSPYGNGGMIGVIQNNTSMTNSINAMNGNSTNSVNVSGGNSPTSINIDVTIDTTFGLNFTNNTYGTTTTLTGFLTDPTFTDLPYLDVSGTDTEGNLYNWDFVFGNLSGKAAYSQYTHLSLHKGDVSAPFYTVMNLDSNTQTYLAYAHLADKHVFMDDTITYGSSEADTVYDYAGTTVLAALVSPGLISKGALVYVNANIKESYTEGSTSMNDLSGSSVVFDFKAGVTAPSLSDGGIDFTPGDNCLQFSEEVSLQTISLWLKKVNADGKFLEMRFGGGENAQMTHIGHTGDFLTGGTVYVNGVLSTYTDWYNHPGNEWVNIVIVGGYPSAPMRLILFANVNLDFTYENIFRSALFYDRALSAEEVLENYNTALVFPQASLRDNPFETTPRITKINVVVKEVDGATAYRLTSQETGSFTEKLVKDNFTDLEQIIGNLSPETEYTVRLYYTTGGIFELVGLVTVSTLVNSAANYDVNEFSKDGRFDLSLLDDVSVNLLSGFMNDLFTTGDDLEIKVQGRTGTTKSKFVNRGGTVNAAESDAFVAPFSADAGPGQSFSLQLSDSTVAVDYDETNNAISIGGTSYTPGEIFALDGKKVTVIDF